MLPVAADIGSPDAARRLVSAARERFGGLDILVNNGGGPPPGTFADFADADWQRAFELLLISVVRMVREARSCLVESEQGRIINVGSSSVREPIPGLILSNSLRAAVAGLAKSLADELAANKITVNTVLPGRILTERLRAIFAERAKAGRIPVDELIHQQMSTEVPLGHVGQPADLASLVAFLCSSQAAYLTGLTVAVDGGRMHSIFLPACQSPASSVGSRSFRSSKIRLAPSVLSSSDLTTAARSTKNWSRSSLKMM